MQKSACIAEILTKVKGGAFFLYLSDISVQPISTAD